MRPLIVAVLVLFGLLAIATMVGAFMSFLTGRADELPQWNGLTYLIFCAKEGAMFGTMCAVPIAVLTFVVVWLAGNSPAQPPSRRRDEP